MEAPYMTHHQHAHSRRTRTFRYRRSAAIVAVGALAAAAAAVAAPASAEDAPEVVSPDDSRAGWELVAEEDFSDSLSVDEEIGRASCRERGVVLAGGRGG